MRLYVIRHGQTTANRDQVSSGQTDVPLTELGWQQAVRIRPMLQRIPFDRVYSSDLSRAVNTQKAALPGVEGIQTPLLREYDVGTLAGTPFGQAPGEDGKEAVRNREYTFFGGENPDMVCRRVKQFLEELEADPCDNVAAFAHGGVLSCLLRVVLNADIDLSAVSSKNCAIHVFEFDGTRWKLLAWNYMSEI